MASGSSTKRVVREEAPASTSSGGYIITIVPWCTLSSSPLYLPTLEVFCALTIIKKRERRDG